jgi:hypothetical protein
VRHDSATARVAEDGRSFELCKEAACKHVAPRLARGETLLNADPNRDASRAIVQVRVPRMSGDDRYDLRVIDSSGRVAGLVPPDRAATWLGALVAVTPAEPARVEAHAGAAALYSAVGMRRVVDLGTNVFDMQEVDDHLIAVVRETRLALLDATTGRELRSIALDPLLAGLTPADPDYRYEMFTEASGHRLAIVASAIPRTVVGPPILFRVAFVDVDRSEVRVADLPVCPQSS